MPVLRPMACPRGQKCGAIRRAALQKPDTGPISMISQRNFDCAAGFCRPLLSARLGSSPHPQPFNRSGFGNARDLGGLMTTAAMSQVTEPVGLPDMKVSVRQVFGIDSDLEVPAYSEVDPHVPEVDSDYRF